MRLLFSLALLALCAPGWSATPDAGPDKNPSPASTGARLARAANPKDFYPAESIRRGQQGIAGVLACVDQNGKLLRDPTITATSGFPQIDAAAIALAKA